MGIRIGLMVCYRSRTGRYSLPAVISATQDTLYRPAVEGGHMAEITARTNVHLTVFTAGYQGHRLPDTDPEISGVAQGGTYQEHDVEQWSPANGEWIPSDQPAGTWVWFE